MKCIVSKWEEKDGANKLTANGLVRINENKPEFGSLMLIAQTVTLSGGFLNKRNKVGFITGRVEDLEATIKAFNLKAGTDYSVAVGTPHKIVTIEKVESEVGDELGFREKINPSTEETLYSKDGEAIFWKTEVQAGGDDLQDVLVDHVREPATDPAVAEFQGEAASTKK